MQDTLANKKKPLIAIDDFPAKVKTTQDVSFTENEPLITLEDWIAHNEKRLMSKLLIMVILVNLIVLISIILWT